MGHQLRGRLGPVSYKNNKHETDPGYLVRNKREQHESDPCLTPKENCSEIYRPRTRGIPRVEGRLRNVTNSLIYSPFELSLFLGVLLPTLTTWLHFLGKTSEIITSFKKPCGLLVESSDLQRLHECHLNQKNFFKLAQTT